MKRVRKYILIPAAAALRFPLTPLVAAAAFAWTVYALPIEYPSPSLAGERLARLLDSTFMRFKYRGDGHVSLSPEVSESTLIQMQNASYVIATQVQMETSGLWAVTSSTRTTSLVLAATQYPVNAESPIVRSKAVDYFLHTRRLKPGPVAEQLRTGDVEEHTILWRGVLHNLASLSAFAVMIASAVLLLADLRTTLRGVLRGRRGLCRRCGYDLHATSADLPCPECGMLASR